MTGGNHSSAALRAWFDRATGWTDAVLPAYAGGSIANVAPSLLNALHVPMPAAMLPPLSSDILDRALLDGVRTIVFIVLDAYGSAARTLGSGMLGTTSTGTFIERQITSVFPSTTAAALTSLQTGAAPGTHGLAGYTLFIPAAQRLVNMVTFKPVDAANSATTAVNPRTFLPVPTIYQLADDVGVEAVVVSHREYQRSPLTLVHSGDTRYRGHRTLAEFMHLLREETCRESPTKRLIFGYWAGIDMLAHSYGPRGEATLSEVAMVERALQLDFIDRIAGTVQDVAVVVTADHGQITVPEADAQPMHRLVAENGGFGRPSTGERRSAGLTLSGDDQRAAVRQILQERGVLLDLDNAIQNGLYGPGPQHPELRERIGNSLLLARSGVSFPFRPPKDDAEYSLGAHGALSADEMRVPLLVWRF